MMLIFFENDWMLVYFLNCMLWVGVLLNVIMLICDLLGEMLSVWVNVFIKLSFLRNFFLFIFWEEFIMNRILVLKFFGSGIFVIKK